MIRGILMLMGVIAFVVWCANAEKNSIPLLMVVAFATAGYLGYIVFGGWW